VNSGHRSRALAMAINTVGYFKEITGSPVSADIISSADICEARLAGISQVHHRLRQEVIRKGRND